MCMSQPCTLRAMIAVVIVHSLCLLDIGATIHVPLYICTLLLCSTISLPSFSWLVYLGIDCISKYLNFILKGHMHLEFQALKVKCLDELHRGKYGCIFSCFSMILGLSCIMNITTEVSNMQLEQPNISRDDPTLWWSQPTYMYIYILHDP